MVLHFARTTVAGPVAAAALSEALESLPTPPVSTEQHDRDDGSGIWEVGGHFAEAPDTAGLALLAHLHGAADFATGRIDDRDWVAQVRAELTPVRAGRFVVYGSHDRARIPSNLVGLEIEAAQAFGTGHHATTQGCLTALDRLARQGFVARRVADIGAGTGVLAMAAASIWPCRAVASDIDPLATETARQNVAANHLADRVCCVTAAGFGHDLIRRTAPYDLVFANILASPLKRLAPGMARHVAPGGVIVLSGLLVTQAASVAAVYRAHGFLPQDTVRIGNWASLVLGRYRRTPARK
jgi:ribosomal protein L11 methyltransferase